MSTSHTLALLLVASTLPLAAAEPLKPMGDSSVRAFAIENLYKTASPDGEINASVIAITHGHTYNSNKLLATFYTAPLDGENLASTTFDLGEVEPSDFLGDTEKPGLSDLRLTKISERLYRFSYNALVTSPSAELQRAWLVYTYDINLDGDGQLESLVPTRIYDSHWTCEGSTMGLVVSGDHRLFFYIEPKQGSQVEPGTLLFSGKSDGKSYSGTVLNWSWDKWREIQSEGTPLVARGVIQGAGNKVVLKARAEEWNSEKQKHVPAGQESTYVLTLDSKLPASQR